jgi:hypothetical protein
MTDDITPTIDDLEDLSPNDAPEVSYRDWTHDQTCMVTYTTEREKFPKDRLAVGLADARAQCQALFGRILEEVVLPAGAPERFFFRVYRRNYRK